MFPGGIQAALHLLDTYGNTKVISNPHLSALDNQKATIKVGDRIPINQQTSSVGGTTTNAVTTTSQYIDTGVLVQVTPHINAGGLVTLDVRPRSATRATPPSPATRRRSTRARSRRCSRSRRGQTMVMGGLITETKQNTSNGLPLISRIPILGGLFGNQDLKNNRTELVLFITPQVRRDRRATYQRRHRRSAAARWSSIEDVFPAARPRRAAAKRAGQPPENVSK